MRNDDHFPPNSGSFARLPPTVHKKEKISPNDDFFRIYKSKVFDGISSLVRLFILIQVVVSIHIYFVTFNRLIASFLLTHVNRVSCLKNTWMCDKKFYSRLLSSRLRDAARGDHNKKRTRMLCFNCDVPWNVY